MPEQETNPRSLTFLAGTRRLVPARKVGASTSTQYIKNVQVQVQVQGMRNVLGYNPSTLQMYLDTITKYQVQMYNTVVPLSSVAPQERLLPLNDCFSVHVCLLHC